MKDKGLISNKNETWKINKNKLKIQNERLTKINKK